jgi:hypothetical protein
VHTAVRERLLPDGVVHAAFFPALAPGEYRLPVWDGGASGPVVRVTGGSVSEVDLRLNEPEGNESCVLR